MINNEKIIAVRKYYADNSDAEHVFKAYTNARETKLTVDYTYKGMKSKIELTLDDNDGVTDIIHNLNERLYKRMWQYIIGAISSYSLKWIDLLFDMKDRIHTMMGKKGELKLYTYNIC